jgi:glycerol-3-phosphate dehydrogenase
MGNGPSRGTRVPDSVVSYTVGTGTALVSSHTVVLFGPEVAGDVAIGLWASVREAASLQEVVDSVMAIGLSNLPSVGIVHRDAQGVRLLLRGGGPGDRPKCRRG